MKNYARRKLSAEFMQLSENLLRKTRTLKNSNRDTVGKSYDKRSGLMTDRLNEHEKENISTSMRSDHLLDARDYAQYSQGRRSNI